MGCIMLTGTIPGAAPPKKDDQAKTGTKFFGEGAFSIAEIQRELKPHSAWILMLFQGPGMG
eukprot:CAMPEP_0185263674 /NCGR_PEP_ID=MMETSP1359-20130426/15617_1 /TAXON_ID=552665 /ORGANISM="Bigelowiella longifila, Strain CCMP242" /LENGTH=60 /DNA_ID=CAMNT_0027851357 /DNA_START=72 /DNA_END=254 /DNA_ORIENTATION=+